MIPKLLYSVFVAPFVQVAFMLLILVVAIASWAILGGIITVVVANLMWYAGADPETIGPVSFTLGFFGGMIWVRLAASSMPSYTNIRGRANSWLTKKENPT
jgi:hypothetical protein